MKKLSSIEESVWGDIRKQGLGDTKKEDIPPQDKEHWWRYIKLDNPTKYPADQLKAYDIIYNLVVYRLFKTMKINEAEQIVVFFKNENAWELTINHDTSYGNDRYTMYAHGPVSPWQIQYSKMDIQEKRSIRDRLENRKFYVYKMVYGGGTQIEWQLREESTFKGEKGIELK